MHVYYRLSCYFAIKLFLDDYDDSDDDDYDDEDDDDDDDEEEDEDELLEEVRQLKLDNEKAGISWFCWFDSLFNKLLLNVLCFGFFSSD